MTHKKYPFIIILIITTILILPLQSLRINHANQILRHENNENNQQNHLTQHNQNDQNIYDQQRYLVDLAQKQNIFKQKIIDIQNDFAGINLMLNDTNLSTNEKKIKLTQALADQRDAILAAQAEVNLPYQLKACQCLNLTQQKRLDIKSQLIKVQSKITQLQKSSQQSNKHCQSHNCTLMKQLNQEINMMKNYQTIMQNTIDSKCCKVVKYQYRDNLDTNNWHFGNTTQSQYQAKIFQREQMNDIKLQPCPYANPYVKIQQNTCFACPVDKPLFNVGTRVCEKDCTEFNKNDAFVLNLTTHVCGYNKNCPEGQSFDETFRKCSQAPSYYNQSSCPPQKPFWDPLSYSCQSCPSQTPFFDVSFKKCRACNNNQIWNESARTCQSSQSCGQGFYFDKVSNKCIATPKDTHSLCPPDRPYWNQLTFSCDSCTSQKPFYDPIQKACRVCTPQQSYNLFTKECVTSMDNIKCGNDQFYNNQTKTCDKRGTTSMCPPSTPYWDATNFKCLQCPSDKPLYNQNSRQCQACPVNTAWSSIYQSCIKSCNSDEQWNSDYKKCIKKQRSCPQKYAFSYQFSKCIEINCDISKPFWNSTANMCQPCPAATIYNYVSNNCEKDSRSGNISVCDQDKPLWNPDYLRCEPCPQGKVWNSQLQFCVQSNKHEHLFSNNYQRHSLKLQHLNRQNKDHHIEGHVYGNTQISYQHRLLSLQNI